MRKTKRVYRFAHGCGSVRAEASRPGALPARPEGDCIRNPRANWALRLHSCRALSSQPQTEANAPFKNAKVTKETCNPCARVLPMCQGETCNLCIGTFMDSRNPHRTALFCSVPRNEFFSGVYICASMSHCFPSGQHLWEQPFPPRFCQIPGLFGIDFPAEDCLSFC